MAGTSSVTLNVVRSSPLAISFVLVAALALFLPGINWGVPSRAVDPVLFGDQQPWSGQKIASLAPPGAGVRGADVDVNPLGRPTGPVVLNADDRQRAELIIRYRLYSHQPDEMITFRSLSRIKEFRGDPRLYQYGGLWIYPVGAMLQLADIVGLVELRGDPSFYFDQPEAFGRFYVVARFYTFVWGLIATWAVFWIVRRLTGSNVIATAGAICFAAMPVVVTMAHEAKPHLPGLALTLLAVIAASKYVDTGRTKWALTAGVLCGAAFGMVISSLLAFAILPMMVFLRPTSWRQRISTLAQAGVLGIVIYGVTNPFVAINAISNREMLRSNLTNSTDMYRINVGGVSDALRLLVDGASPIVVIGGVVGLAVLLAAKLRRRRLGCIEECPGRGDVGWLLLAPTALVVVQFVLLADGKPPEYARFGLLPDTFLLVSAFAGIALLRSARPRAILAVATTAITLAFSMPYVRAFVRDAGPNNSRLVAARQIQKRSAADLYIRAEPAPYAVPPVDLFRTRLLLTQARGSADAEVLFASPWHSSAPISWADTSFLFETSTRPRAATVSSP